MKTTYKLFLSLFLCFSIATFFVSCEEEDDDEPAATSTSTKSSGSATLRVTVNMTSGAYDCITVDYGETYVNARIFTPGGSLLTTRQGTIGSYSSDEGAYEVDFSITGITSSGTYKIEIWDQPNTYMYEDDTELVSSSDIENSRTERSYCSISKSDAGC